MLKNMDKELLNSKQTEQDFPVEITFKVVCNSHTSMNNGNTLKERIQEYINQCIGAMDDSMRHWGDHTHHIETVKIELYDDNDNLVDVTDKIVNKESMQIDNPGKINENTIYDDTELSLENEFDLLYSKWYSSYCFSAHGCAEPKAQPNYEVLKTWCLKHKDIALQFINEKLKYGPCDLVRLLDDIWGEEYKMSSKNYISFISLDLYCNLWLNAINHTNKKNYYKDWNKWKRHLDKYYIPWNPFKEDDPNVTLEEYQQGKRNEHRI